MVSLSDHYSQCYFCILLILDWLKNRMASSIGKADEYIFIYLLSILSILQIDKSSQFK